MKKLSFDLPEGHCVVRRAKGYGPAHMPHEQVAIQEGQYYHMAYSEVYQRADWEQVDTPPDELMVEVPDEGVEVVEAAEVEAAVVTVEADVLEAEAEAEAEEDTNGDGTNSNHEGGTLRSGPSGSELSGPDVDHRRRGR